MSSPVRLKLKRTDISIPWKDSLKGGGSQQACSAANISRIELIGPSGAWTAWATRLLKVMRESRPIDGYDGAQGQEPNTPQNDGVQGTPSKRCTGPRGSGDRRHLPEEHPASRPPRQRSRRHGFDRPIPWFPPPSGTGVGRLQESRLRATARQGLCRPGKAGVQAGAASEIGSSPRADFQFAGWSPIAQRQV